MIVMSIKSKSFIERHIPSVAHAEEPNEILKELYDLIMDKGFKSWNEGYNSFGTETQEVYDDIYYSNFED